MGIARQLSTLLIFFSNASASFHTLREAELEVQVPRIRDKAWCKGKSIGTSSQG